MSTNSVMALALGIVPPQPGMRPAVEIRCAWRIGNLEGWGLWVLDTPAARAKVQALVDEGNRLYGAMSHSIEERFA